MPKTAIIQQVQLPLSTSSATTGEQIVMPRETVLTTPKTSPCSIMGVSSITWDMLIAEDAKELILKISKLIESSALSQSGSSLPGAVSLSAISMQSDAPPTQRAENKIVYAFTGPKLVVSR